MPEFSEAFMEAGDWAYKQGARNIKALPGAWVGKVDENWMIAVNGHAEEVKCEPEGTMGADIPPYSMAVWWNGWLAGIFNAAGGAMAAGELANEDTFIAALKRDANAEIE